MRVVLMRRGIFAYVLLFIAVAVVLGPYFIRNVTWLLSDQALRGLIEFRFDFVILYVALFSSFTIFLILPLSRNRWQKSNFVYVAFIIALFTEMFGFPLSIYLLSSLMPLPHADFEPSVALTVDLPGLHFRLLTTSLIAGVVTLSAAILIILGWKDIYRNRKSGKLVTGGIYRYMRHPQYTGIIMITLAWLFAWPTLPTLVMWPILAAAYYRLSRKEEKEMLRLFGKQYKEYMKSVPMFLPGWNW
jgi:protein-S-isoprenylcysteine O-methyltransferase Ste14